MQTRECSSYVLQTDHLQELVVCHYSEGAAIEVHVELHMGIYDG